MAFSLWTYAYVTLDDVLHMVGGNPADPSDVQDFWGEIVNVACRAVEDYCGRQIVARSVTEYRDGRGEEFIYPRHGPASSIVLYVDTTRQWGSDTLLQATTPIAVDDEYFYDSTENCIKLLGWKLPGKPWDPVVACVKLTYTGGWAYTTTGTWPGLEVASDSIPAPIRQATLMVAQALHLKAGGRYGKGLLGMAAVSSSLAGSVAPISTIELTAMIPKEAKQLLAPYRRNAGVL